MATTNFPQPIQINGKNCKTLVEMEEAAKKKAGREVYTRYRNALKVLLKDTKNFKGVKIPQIGEIEIPTEFTPKLDNITKLIICDDKLFYYESGKIKKIQFDATVPKEKIVIEDSGYIKTLRNIIKQQEKIYLDNKKENREDVNQVALYNRLLIIYKNLLEDKVVQNRLEKKKVIDIIETTNALLRKVNEVFYIESTFINPQKIPMTIGKTNALGEIQDIENNTFAMQFQAQMLKALVENGNKEIKDELNRAKLVVKRNKINLYMVKDIEDGTILKDYDEKKSSLYKFLTENGAVIQELYKGNEDLDKKIATEEYEETEESLEKETDEKVTNEEFKQAIQIKLEGALNKWKQYQEIGQQLDKIGQEVSTYAKRLWANILITRKTEIKSLYKEKYEKPEKQLAPKALIQAITKLGISVDELVTVLPDLMEYIPEEVCNMKLAEGGDNKLKIETTTKAGRQKIVEQVIVLENIIDRTIGLFNGIIYYSWVRYCTRYKERSTPKAIERYIQEYLGKIETFVYTENIQEITNKLLERDKLKTFMLCTLPKYWSREIFEHLNDYQDIPYEKRKEGTKEEMAETRVLVLQTVLAILEQYNNYAHITGIKY